jgi:hypothetical protein
MSDRPHCDECNEYPDPRELDGEWVIDGSGTGAAKIGYDARICRAIVRDTDEDVVLITAGSYVLSIPTRTLRKIIG